MRRCCFRFCICCRLIHIYHDTAWGIGSRIPTSFDRILQLFKYVCAIPPQVVDLIWAREGHVTLAKRGGVSSSLLKNRQKWPFFCKSHALSHRKGAPIGPGSPKFSPTSSRLDLGKRGPCHTGQKERCNLQFVQKWAKTAIFSQVPCYEP